jgi:hypothetical protein
LSVHYETIANQPDGGVTASPAAATGQWDEEYDFVVLGAGAQLGPAMAFGYVAAISAAR